MIHFLPPDSQYDFSPLDTPILTIKTDDNDLFEWDQYRFDTLSPIPAYYGPFHDAMVSMDQDLDPGYHEVEKEEVIPLAVDEKAKLPSKQATPPLPDHMVKIEGEIIQLEPILHHRTLRKRNATPNYNEDQRRRHGVSIASSNNDDTGIKMISKGEKKKTLTIKIDASLASSSLSNSPSSATSVADRFSACLCCRQRKIKCVPNSTRFNINSCQTCIRRRKKCEWQKIRIRQSKSTSPTTSSKATKAKKESPKQDETVVIAATNDSEVNASSIVSEEKKSKSNTDPIEEIDATQEDSTAKESLSSLAIIKEEMLDTLMQDDQELVQEDALLQTPLSCSSRAFGRCMSSSSTLTCTPALSPASSSDSAFLSLSSSSSPMPTSPCTPTDPHCDALITIIHPTSQTEEDCLLLLPNITSNGFEAESLHDWNNQLL